MQLSRNDRVAMDAAAQQRVLGVLEAAKLAPEVSYLVKDRLVMRFSDDEQRTAAQEAIVKGTKGDYLVALSSVPRTPEFMREVGLKPMSLGLDLRGGVHFVYEVDVQGALVQAMERMERDARTTLRDKRVPYGAVTQGDGAVRVVLRNASDLQAALDALKAPDGSLQLTSGEGADGTYVEMRMTPQELKRRQDVAIEQNITTLRNRVDELGIAEPSSRARQRTASVVQLPARCRIRTSSACSARPRRSMPTRRRGHSPSRGRPSRTSAFRSAEEAVRHIRPHRTGWQLPRRIAVPNTVKREIIATGEQLTDATFNINTQEGQPQVNVKLDSRGGQSMLNATKDNVGKRMAVVYISKKQLAQGELLLCDVDHRHALADVVARRVRIDWPRASRA